MRTTYEVASEKEAIKRWMLLLEEPYISQQTRAKALMKEAIREELTDTQRRYMVAYYGGMTMQAIADEHGVNRSTVSRSIARGRKRLQKVLKYCGPDLLEESIRGKS